MKNIDADALVTSFCTLAGIEGTPFKEKAVAGYIKQQLEPLGVHIIEQSIPVGNSDTGNILCIPEGTDTGKPLLILTAHMDTVRSTAALKPVVKDGVIASDGTTILGADNRAGVTALLYMLRIAHENRLPLKNIVVLFTVAEEVGMVGARHLDLSDYPSIERILVFDCSKRPGIFIRHCFGCLKFKVDVHGKPAHAGVAPEKGVNAIAIAAGIINDLQQGRLDDEATFNIGTIRGGDASNVVSSEVVFDGEIRGPSMEIIERHLDRLRQTTSAVAARFNGTASIETHLAFAPFYIDPSSADYAFAEEVIRKAGLTPDPIRYTGGSDANAYNARGIPAINFGIGAQQPHSNEEFIRIEDLVKTTEIVLCAAVNDTT